MVFLDALATVFPVLLLFALGAVLARRGTLRPSTLEDLRGLVLRFTLPSALFLTFLRVSLEPRFLVVVVAVFSACVAMLALGPLLGRLIGDRSPLLPPLLTGFEAGMLGYAIYGAVYGTDALYRFAIVDIGQVVFVFFVLATVLVRRDAERPPSLVDTVRSFVRTPVILAIAGGIAASAVGVGPVLDHLGFGRALLTTLGALAAMTTPLICIVIGGSTRLSRGALGRPLRTVALRMGAWVALATVFAVVVVEGLLGLDRGFVAAVLTMAVLPPPFVIPLYVRPGSTPEAEREFVLGTLSLATIATLVAYSAVVVVLAP